MSPDAKSATGPEDHLSNRQRRWIGHKANWEHMSRSAVRAEWDVPPDEDLTPCGASGCYGCPTCVEAT